MRSKFHAAISAALVSISFAAAAAMPEARRLHSIDVFQLEYADDVQISPMAAASSTCASATTS